MLTIDIDSLRLDDAARALDLGCGEGRHFHALAERGGVFPVGLDHNAEAVGATRSGARSLWPDADEKCAVLFGDASRLPFADQSFDVVICSEVLEHLVDWQDAIAEIARVCRPGARLAVSVPRGWPERICWTLAPDYAKAPGGHVRIFKPGAIVGEVERYGFSCVRKHFAHGLHSPYWWLRCLFWKSQDENRLIALYKKFLEWDILKRPAVTRGLEKIAAPVMGKSVVLYFERTRTPI